MKTSESYKINVQFKLSALWASVMFCYIYGDYFMLFVPGHIEGLMRGNSGAGTITPIKLLLFAIMMSIPSLMVFLSLLLKPVTNRIVNIITGIFFTAIMVIIAATSIDKWLIFSIYLALIEIVITLLIVRYAWRWPKEG